MGEAEGEEAVNFIGEFELALSGEAARSGADGVMCGHIHHAVIGTRHGIEYINTGDWVESCTAVVEHHDGRLELVEWTTLRPVIETATEPEVTVTPAAAKAA